MLEVAHRLQTLSSLTPEDLVGRLGADEFVVVVNTANSQGWDALVAEVHAAFDAPVDLAGGPIHSGASVGAARCPADGTDVDALLRAADAAMYRVKNDPRAGTEASRHRRLYRAAA